MTEASLNMAIRAEAQKALQNRSLRKKDILEWSTGDVKAENKNEVVVFLPDLQVNICVLKTKDKRKQ